MLANVEKHHERRTFARSLLPRVGSPSLGKVGGWGSGTVGQRSRDSRTAASGLFGPDIWRCNFQADVSHVRHIVAKAFGAPHGQQASKDSQDGKIFSRCLPK